MLLLLNEAERIMTKDTKVMHAYAHMPTYTSLGLTSPTAVHRVKGKGLSHVGQWRLLSSFWTGSRFSGPGMQVYYHHVALVFQELRSVCCSSPFNMKKNKYGQKAIRAVSRQTDDTLQAAVSAEGASRCQLLHLTSTHARYLKQGASNM
jgi:hypothetical protein